MTFDQAAANMRLIGKQLQAANIQTNKDREVSTLPTKDVHIHPMADRTLLPIAFALMFVVGLVLLIACANVASMLLARASGRQKEIGIRLAIGASRRRLVQQLLSESLVMAVLGAAAGVALAWALTQAAMSISLPIPIPLSFALRIDGRVLLFTAGVAMLAALVAGLAPALKATRPNLVTELKSDVAGARVGVRRWTLRDGLVVTQIAVTMVLLVAAGLLTRSLSAAQRVGIGFEPEGLAIVSMEMSMLGYNDSRAKEFYDRALERVRAIPGVTSAALAGRLPFSIDYNRNNLFFADRHGPNDKGVVVDVARVSAEYFATLGVPIVQGRNFSPADTPESPGVAIINEAMARKYWPNQDPLGKRFRATTYTGPQYEVVGVSADYKVSTIGEGATPYVLYAVSQRPDSSQDDHGADAGRRRGAGRGDAARAAGARAERPLPRQPDDEHAGRRDAAAGEGRCDRRERGGRGGDAARVDRAVRRDRVFRRASNARNRNPDGARREPVGGCRPGDASGSGHRCRRRRDRDAVVARGGEGGCRRAVRRQLRRSGRVAYRDGDAVDGRDAGERDSGATGICGESVDRAAVGVSASLPRPRATSRRAVRLRRPALST